MALSTRHPWHRLESQSASFPENVLESSQRLWTPCGGVGTSVSSVGTSDPSVGTFHLPVGALQ